MITPGNINHAEKLAELGEGIYNITLKKPFEKEYKGEILIRFPFTVDGFMGKIRPLYFYLIKSQVSETSSKLGLSNNLAESIRKCFDVILPFEEKYYEYWVGRKGRVLASKDRNGKRGLVFFFKNKNLSEVRKKIIEDMYDFRKAARQKTGRLNVMR